MCWNVCTEFVRGLNDTSATAAFLYPGYASYKTLSQRPASEADLERWLMYWSVLGCIVAVEYVAEWLVSWCVVGIVHVVRALCLTRNTAGCRSTSP